MVHTPYKIHNKPHLHQGYGGKRNEKMNDENLEYKPDLGNQNSFLEHLEKEKERLIKRHHKKGLMPSHIRKLPPNSPPRGWIPLDQMESYETPEIVDEFIDYENKLGVIVIKAQIDYCSGWGLQHIWAGYCISEEKTEMVADQTAYQIQIIKGVKEINIKASELHKEIKQGEEK